MNKGSKEILPQGTDLHNLLKLRKVVVAQKNQQIIIIYRKDLSLKTMRLE